MGIGRKRKWRERPWLITAFLTVAFTLSYVDRHVISLLLEPITQSLHLSDTQMGLMQGLSFSLCYVLASLPLARLSDRGHRPRIISACIAVWSAMTILCGFAVNFWQLLLARIGVAASESGLPPAALTMMADLHDQKGLARANSIFMIAPFLGGGIALMGGGALYQWVQQWTLPDIAGVGSLQPWQWVFILIGMPGIAVAIVMQMLSEPRRQAFDAPRRNGMAELLGFLRREWRSNGAYLLAIAFMALLLNAYVSWVPAALMRLHQANAQRIGMLFGPIFLCGGILGTVMAGVLVGRRNDEVVLRAFRFMRGCAFIALPAVFITPWVSSLWLQLALIAVTIVCTSSVMGISSLPMLYIAPQHLRAQAVAFLGLVSALLGTGLGPLLVGVLSDALTFTAHPLMAALAVAGSAAALLAGLSLHSIIRRAGDGSAPLRPDSCEGATG